MLVVAGWNKSLFPPDKQPVVEKESPDLREITVDYEVKIAGGHLTLNVTSAPVPDVWES